MRLAGRCALLPPLLSRGPEIPLPQHAPKMPLQASMSQLSALSGGGGGATLLHEVMSFLRRCLTQVGEVADY